MTSCESLGEDICTACNWVGAKIEDIPRRHTNQQEKDRSPSGKVSKKFVNQRETQQANRQMKRCCMIFFPFFPFRGLILSSYLHFPLTGLRFYSTST